MTRGRGARGPCAGLDPRAMNLRTVLRSNPVRSAIADTDRPSWCRSRITIKGLRELIVILDLHKEGLSVSAIAERTGLDRKTIRKYIARGVEPPQYGPRAPRPRIMDPYEAYVRERLAAFPELSVPRLLREIRPLGYAGGRTSR